MVHDIARLTTVLPSLMKARTKLDANQNDKIGVKTLLQKSLFPCIKQVKMSKKNKTKSSVQ